MLLLYLNNIHFWKLCMDMVNRKTEKYKIKIHWNICIPFPLVHEVKSPHEFFIVIAMSKILIIHVIIILLHAILRCYCFFFLWILFLLSIFSIFKEIKQQIKNYVISWSLYLYSISYHICYSVEYSQH